MRFGGGEGIRGNNPRGFHTGMKEAGDHHGVDDDEDEVGARWLSRTDEAGVSSTLT